MFKIQTQVFCFQRMGNLEIRSQVYLKPSNSKLPSTFKIRTKYLEIQKQVTWELNLSFNLFQQSKF